MIAIVDAGPLYATVDSSDANHVRSLEVLQRADLDFVIPALVVAEVSYLVGRRLGARIEASFLRALEAYEVEAPSSGDWRRIADLVEQYADFPLGGTDASVATLAERLGTDLIVTVDRRHFEVVRRADGGSFRILPD